MYSHKVIYLETSFINKKKMFGAEVDGVNTSKELEALIIEQVDKGFKLVSVTPVTGNASNVMSVVASATVGFLVTFEKL